MKRPTIRTTLMAMLGAIGLAVMLLSYISLSNISSLGTSTAEIGHFWMERLLTAREIKGEFSNLRLSLASHMMVTDKASFDTEQAALAGYSKAMDDDIAKYESGVRTEKGRALVNEIKGPLADYLANAKVYTDLVAANKMGDAASYFNKDLKPTADAVNDKINALVDFIVATADARVNEADAEVGTAFNLVIGFATATILICGAGIFFALSGIARPIQMITGSMRNLADGDDKTEVPFGGRADEIGAMAAAVEVFRQNAIANKRLEQEALANRSQAERNREAEQARMAREAEQLRIATSTLGENMKRLADGDLTCRINTQFAEEYESLRADFNATVDQLSQTVGSVLASVQNMDSGTREISSGATDLSRRTEQQAASLEETAAALDQITVNVASSSKMTDEARQVAQAANQSAAHSVKVVSHAEDAMGRIEGSSQQISNIIGVIDEIAFQTNLLALNAGVEAARAGEAGKGFAVVAQEVRELAQRSAKAAKEIKGLIQNSTTEVESGVKLVRETGEALKTIGEYIAKINGHMESIATSAREQSTGLSEVNIAVNQMDQTTQQNAAMVEQSTAAAASLAQEAGKLRDLVSNFQLDQQATAQVSSLRQTASSMARPATPMQPHAAPARSKPTQGNLAQKTDNWEEF